MRRSPRRPVPQRPLANYTWPVPHHIRLLLCTIVLSACSPESRWPAQAHAAAGSVDPREAMLARATVELLEREHLLHKRVDDELSRVAFGTYLDRLDSSKMFLLKADRDALAKYADKIDDELRGGSLELGHEGERLLIKRVAMVQAWVARLLASPLDHSNQEYVELDPKKTPVAAAEAELQDRWRRRLELEVLDRVAQMQARLEPPKAEKTPHPAAGPGRPKDKTSKEGEDSGGMPLADIPKTPEGREAKARADLAKSYAARFTRMSHPGKGDAAADLINAVTASVDPHTNYLPPADKANFDINMRGQLEGIGAQLREKDDYIEIIELVPGGAAWRQGQLDPGDLILAVGSGRQEPVDVVNMRIDEVVKMIRGPKGTVVRLRVRKATGLQETVAITRDIIVVEETYARAALLSRKGQPAYGYIHLPSFYGGQGSGARSSASDVRRLLGELRGKHVAGIVLDIRTNGGGLLGDAVEMSGAFIDKGPIVQVQDSTGRKQVLSDDAAGVDFDGPVIVLVDRFSASASEILAGALQDYHRAIIVGTGPTHGKGTVQAIFDLDRATGGKLDLGVFKLTIQQFYRVDGASTQREGVKPDIVLPDPEAWLETGERELEHALPWSQIAPARHDNWPATWSAATLAARSSARVDKEPAFARIARLTQLMKARKADTRVSLAQAEFMKRREQERAEIAAATPDNDSAPERFTVTPLENAAPVAAAPNGRKDSRLTRWRDNLGRDPWVDECLNILADAKK